MDAPLGFTNPVFSPRPWYSPLPWFRWGDLDGTATMLSQNLATLLIAAKLLYSIFEVSGADVANRLVYERVVPGMGVSMFFGCVFYAIQAQVVARATGRTDLCAQPFGISTPGVFVFASSIVATTFAGTGHDAERTWRIACLANMIQGIVELLCSALGPYAVKFISLGALLTALANIGFAFLLTQPLQALGAAPLVALPPVVILLLAQLADVRIPKLPTAVPPILAATVMAWVTGHLDVAGVRDSASLLGLCLPTADMQQFEYVEDAMRHIGIILPVALTSSIGTLQCQQLAANAGDDYSLRITMFGDGLATIIAAACGSPFGFTVYIGHPAMKRLGCGVGYNLLTGLIMLLLCISGSSALILNTIPVEGLNSFVIFVGLIVCADGLKVLPERHWPAFLIGLVPGICSWAVTQASTFAESVWPNRTQPDFTSPELWRSNSAMDGLFMLSNGYILSSVCLCSIFMGLIDRDFLKLFAWCMVSAVLSMVGLIHSPSVFLPWQRSLSSLEWQFAIAYGCCGVVALALYIGQIYEYVPERLEEPSFESDVFASVLEARYEEKSSRATSQNSSLRRGIS